jgi:hypothetical protein
MSAAVVQKTKRRSGYGRCCEGATEKQQALKSAVLELSEKHIYSRAVTGIIAD